jgi:formate dehydrogenase iron-sulfur subunit
VTDVLTRQLSSAPDGPTPIDEWLRRQQDLTAVERFSSHHDTVEATGFSPAGRWRDRLPATPPGPGQQYAFEVDLDACTGCKACVAACHNLNGLDEGEAWRRVGSVHDAGSASGGRAGGAITVTSACHHCVDPACLKGCPAQAYEKDPDTGIVRHLDDDCIGCSYCTLTCPYEVPVFNQDLGIVRKCDLCSDRLAEGEAPACVQGCPQGAITIGLASTADLVATLRDAAGTGTRTLVPSAPRSELTVPATTYRSKRPVPSDWVAADRSSVHPSHGHTPLAVMLVLTQAAVGMTVAAAWLAHRQSTDTEVLAAVGLGTGLLALGASILHLGRPLLAWRAILGLRHSWLSREILAFGLFAGAGTACAAARLVDLPSDLIRVAEAATVAGGIAGVACSTALYAVTGRRWWRTPVTGTRFAATTLACGAAGTAAVLATAAPDLAGPLIDELVLAAAAGVLISVVVPLIPLIAPGRRRGVDAWELGATRRLLGHQLSGRFLARVVLAAIGMVLLAAAGSSAAVLAVAALVITLGEYHERRLFFLASVAPRMPGSPR